MKRIPAASCLVALWFGLVWGAMAQETVVVIPLVRTVTVQAPGQEPETCVDPVGDAEPGDVLVDKTFSNSLELGLVGTRPPAPVPTDGLEYEHTVQPPSPRFYNVAGEKGDGYGVEDYLTGLIWEKTLSPAEYTPSGAWNHCEDLFTSYAIPGLGFMTVVDWRLPTITELLSLVHYQTLGPALPPEVRTGLFVNLDNWGEYWGSTSMSNICTDFSRGSLVRYLDLGSGDSDSVQTCASTPSPEKRAWCVRGPYDQ
jgi:hypothetical protein